MADSRRHQRLYLVVIVVIASAILWCRSSFDFGHIARSLPFSGGHRPGIYDVGAVVMLLLCLWGFSRLKRGARPAERPDIEDSDPAEDPYEGYETDDDDDGDE